MQGIRIIEIPQCKMVSSGNSMFGQEKFERFNKWFSDLPESIHPKDFLCRCGNELCWLYLYDDSMAVPDEFEIINFEGGLYAVATDIDQQTNIETMLRETDEFLYKYGFVRDDTRCEMGNIITSQTVAEALGYYQMDYYFPIKLK